MKIKAAALLITTMLVTFPFVTVRAADARMFEGVNLDELRQTPRREAAPVANAERPVGHGTHNLLVKDRKTKQLYLVVLRQDRVVDLKTVGDKIGAKELRLA